MNAPHPPIMLLHGGWGGAWCWSSVLPFLAAAGHPVLALDLPGGGLNVVGPPNPDTQGSGEKDDARSPLAELSFANYAAPAREALRSVHKRFGSVVVVAHSINGMLLHDLGERYPEMIRRLVYVAAVAPAPDRTVAMDSAEEPWSSSQFGSLLVADPNTVGVMRIASRSADPAYQEALRRCWFADVPAARAAVATRMLAADTPAVLLNEPAALSADRWGSVSRTWIRTSEDASIPVDGQDTNVMELDQAFPAHRFDVHTLQSGHMPFLSVPEKLAELLIAATTTEIAA